MEDKINAYLTVLGHSKVFWEESGTQDTATVQEPLDATNEEADVEPSATEPIVAKDPMWRDRAYARRLDEYRSLDRSMARIARDQPELPEPRTGPNIMKRLDTRTTASTESNFPITPQDDFRAPQVPPGMAQGKEALAATCDYWEHFPSMPNSHKRSCSRDREDDTLEEH